VTSYLVKPVSKQAVHKALAAPKAADLRRPDPNGRSLMPGDTLLAGKKVLIASSTCPSLRSRPKPCQAIGKSVSRPAPRITSPNL